MIFFFKKSLQNFDLEVIMMENQKSWKLENLQKNGGE